MLQHRVLPCRYQHLPTIMRHTMLYMQHHNSDGSQSVCFMMSNVVPATMMHDARRLWLRNWTLRSRSC